MRIAAAQIDCVPGDVQANVAAIVQQIREAARQRCDLVVLPELADVGYDLTLAAERASAWDEEPMERLREAAQAHRIAVVAGLSERSEERVYNSAALIDSDGKLAGSYRKVHLFSPSGEPDAFEAGDARCAVEVNGWRCRIGICYDLRFPESFRDLSAEPADLLIVCSAWPAARSVHWKTLLAARALENQAYVAASNRAGTDAGLTFAGSSAIVSPTGEAICQADAHFQGVICADLTRGAVSAARSAIPVHRDARTDTYRDSGLSAAQR